MDEYKPKLGFGVMRMPRKENQINAEIDWNACEQIIDRYMQSDFCYFDTHPQYMDGKSHEIIRRYVVGKYSKEKYYIADKMPYYIKNKSDYDRIFNRSLEELGG